MKTKPPKSIGREAIMEWLREKTRTTWLNNIKKEKRVCSEWVSCTGRRKYEEQDEENIACKCSIEKLERDISMEISRSLKSPQSASPLRYPVARLDPSLSLPKRHSLCLTVKILEQLGGINALPGTGC
ncbi:hypothetical protein HPP92_028837 [Vanilla planifolia]|uniref:Uncharacterized protein n=1 Tax=Vanilla planifolia TaxID=51239 RepID=A0A835P689_VANPL|nr:hypothetical protein HPP92_028837 [Vanilla planifolia]KAG0446459.1 hypothetical protein HPP92_028826 [Vanilla planifolia]